MLAESIEVHLQRYALCNVHSFSILSIEIISSVTVVVEIYSIHWTISGNEKINKLTQIRRIFNEFSMNFNSAPFLCNPFHFNVIHFRVFMNYVSHHISLNN